MALFVGLDVSLKTVSICIVKADGSVVWEGKALSEPASLIKALARRRRNIQLVGIEACPLSEWLYGAFVDSVFTTICIETRHAQRFLSSRPNKTDRYRRHDAAWSLPTSARKASGGAAPSYDARCAQEVRRSHTGDRREPSAVC
jgi:transposase